MEDSEDDDDDHHQEMSREQDEKRRGADLFRRGSRSQRRGSLQSGAGSLKRRGSILSIASEAASTGASSNQSGYEAELVWRREPDKGFMVGLNVQSEVPPEHKTTVLTPKNRPRRNPLLGHSSGQQPSSPTRDQFASRTSEGAATGGAMGGSGHSRDLTREGHGGRGEGGEHSERAERPAHRIPVMLRSPTGSVASVDIEWLAQAQAATSPIIKGRSSMPPRGSFPLETSVLRKSLTVGEMESEDSASWDPRTRKEMNLMGSARDLMGSARDLMGSERDLMGSTRDLGLGFEMGSQRELGLVFEDDGSIPPTPYAGRIRPLPDEPNGGFDRVDSGLSRISSNAQSCASPDSFDIGEDTPPRDGDFYAGSLHGRAGVDSGLFPIARGMSFESSNSNGSSLVVHRKRTLERAPGLRVLDTPEVDEFTRTESQKTSGSKGSARSDRDREKGLPELSKLVRSPPPPLQRVPSNGGQMRKASTNMRVQAVLNRRRSLNALIASDGTPRPNIDDADVDDNTIPDDALESTRWGFGAKEEEPEPEEAEIDYLNPGQHRPEGMNMPTGGLYPAGGLYLPGVESICRLASHHKQTKPEYVSPSSWGSAASSQPGGRRARHHSSHHESGWGQIRAAVTSTSSERRHVGILGRTTSTHESHQQPEQANKRGWAQIRASVTRDSGVAKPGSSDSMEFGRTPSDGRSIAASSTTSTAQPHQSWRQHSHSFAASHAHLPDHVARLVSSHKDQLQNGNISRTTSNEGNVQLLPGTTPHQRGASDQTSGRGIHLPQHRHRGRRDSLIGVDERDIQIGNLPLDAQSPEMRRTQTASSQGGVRSRSRSVESRNQDDDAVANVDALLNALGIQCDRHEQVELGYAFMCPVCDNEVAATTTSDQIRAVCDAFKLIDADMDGYVTLKDLRDIASWALDERGTDFINRVIAMLEKTMLGVDEDETAPISRKDFLVAFARTLVIDEQEDVVEMMNQRSQEYREIGRVFGIERADMHFVWRKFWLTFATDVLASGTSLVIWVVDWHRAREARRKGEPGPKKTLDRLFWEAQWLPIGAGSYKEFQYYLMKLWLPSTCSFLLYITFFKSMVNISLAEVLSPFAVYWIVGTYVSVISGFEPSRLVLRRVNPALSDDARQNELQAVFAFRAHTPEGHTVDQIGKIADVLFGSKFRALSNHASALAGLIHALVPTLHRAYHWSMGWGPYSEDMPLYMQVYFCVCGGFGWEHLLVSVPSTAVSGYLTYRLLYIAAAGFYSDLAFFNRLIIFRAASQPDNFLRFRAQWLRALSKMQDFHGRREFAQFLSLQKLEDLLLWCRVRNLLVESYAGFRKTQGEVLVTLMSVAVLAYTIHIFFVQLPKDSADLTVFDVRSRVDVVFFTTLLIIMVRLKLSIFALRKADIGLLHREYYASCMEIPEKKETLAFGSPLQSGSPYSAMATSQEGGYLYEENGSQYPYLPGGALSSYPPGSGAGAYPAGARHPPPRSVPRPPPKAWKAQPGGIQRTPSLPTEKVADEWVMRDAGLRPSLHSLPLQNTMGLKEASWGANSRSSGTRPSGDPSSGGRDTTPMYGGFVQGWGLVGAPSAAAGGGMYGNEPATGVMGGMYGLGPGFGEHPGWDAGDGGKGGEFGGAGEQRRTEGGNNSEHTIGRWPDMHPAEAETYRMLMTGEMSTHSLVQELLGHTARHINTTEKPPRLLSFNVSVSFLRYFFVPLLSPLFAAFNLYTSGGRPDRSGGSTTGRESLRNFSASNLTINATGMETVRNLTSSNFSASDFTLHGNAVGLETVRNLTLPATGLETAHNLIRSTPGRETASNFTPSGVPASGLEPSSVSNGHDSGREPASDSAGAKSSGREPASDTTGQDSGLDAAGSLGEGLPFLDAGSREKTRGFSGLDLGVEDAGGFSLAGDLPGEKFDKKLEPLGEKLEL